MALLIQDRKIDPTVGRDRFRFAIRGLEARRRDSGDGNPEPSTLTTLPSVLTNSGRRLENQRTADGVHAARYSPATLAAVLRKNCRRDLKRAKLRPIRREEMENQGRSMMGTASAARPWTPCERKSSHSSQGFGSDSRPRKPSSSRTRS